MESGLLLIQLTPASSGAAFPLESALPGRGQPSQIAATRMRTVKKAVRRIMRSISTPRPGRRNDLAAVVIRCQSYRRSCKFCLSLIKTLARRSKFPAGGEMLGLSSCAAGARAGSGAPGGLVDELRGGCEIF